MIFKPLHRALLSHPAKSPFPLPLHLPRRTPPNRTHNLHTLHRPAWTQHPDLPHYLRILSWTIKSLFIYHCFHTYIYSLLTAAGPSMLPTMSVGNEWFLVDRSSRRGRNVKVGDIVTFDSVLEPGEKAFKRVLGLEGDCVMMGTPETGDTKMIRIPQGHCWLVGDNLEWSRDSRLFGPVPMALIKGKIIARVLPLGDRKWFENELQPEPKRTWFQSIYTWFTT